MTRQDRTIEGVPLLVDTTPRRGLSREEAARYVGVSATKFDELVKSARMPVPRRIDGRKVWDIRALDLAFDALPVEHEAAPTNSWEDVS